MPAKIRHLRHRDLDGLERDRLNHMASDLASGVIQPGRFIQDTFTGIAFASNEITIAGEDGLVDGTPVLLEGADLPLGLEAGNLYFLSDSGVNTYTLHESLEEAITGTNVVAFTDAGSGTLTITQL